MLRHRTLLPSLHFDTPNPDIDFAGGPFFVNTQTREWTGGGGPLRAGVSSFGIGGTNAHAVLQQAPEPAGSDPSGGPHLLVLSAKTPAALESLAVDLARHLDDRPELDLADVAYTLAMGRGAHRCRRAVLSHDGPAAARALRAGAHGEPDTAAPEAAGAVPVAAARRAWLAGQDVDWYAFYAGQRRRRVPLPTYPFQGHRCWLPAVTPPVPIPASGVAAGGALHPLLDANVSTLRECRYATTRTGAESYLADHLVSGEPVLPAAACLEMARAAGSALAEAPVAALRGVTFERPLSYAAGPRTSYLSLWRRDDVLRFAVTADDDVYVRGELLLSTATGSPGPVDVEAVRGRCPHRRPPEAWYELFAAHGLRYGPTLRPVRELVHGAGEALATLEMPAACADGFDGFTLHPSLLDGALQTVVALIAADGAAAGPGDAAAGAGDAGAGPGDAAAGAGDAAAGAVAAGRASVATGAGGAEAGPAAAATYSPLALGRLDIYRPLPRRCLVHVVVPPGGARDRLRKADVTVLDPAGTVLVRMVELSVRIGHVPVGSGAARSDPVAPVLLRAGWTQRPAAGAPPTGTAGPYLLLAEEFAWRDALVAGLRKDGDAPIVIAAPGAAYARHDARRYTIDPDCPEDFVRLLDALHLDGHLPATILHTWSGLTVPAPTDEPDVDAAQNPTDEPDVGGGDLGAPWYGRGVRSLLYLTKALTVRRDPPVRLLYAYRVTEDGGSPAHEAVAGFARAVTLENPRLSFRTVGVGPGVDPARTLLGDLGAVESEVRHVGGRRLIRRYRRVDAGADGSRPIAARHGGAYLIAGGGGGLGRIFAERLARRAGAHVVLVGRSDPTPALLDRIAERRPASVRYLRADITDAGQVRSLVDRVRAECGEIRGVIHAAGVLRDSFLLRKTPEEFAAVVAPKVLGTLRLDRATAGDPLDFFVTFSSIAAAFGNVGQADYAYANAFLDAYAQHRESLVAHGMRSGRTFAIAWPQWLDGGMRQDARAAAAVKDRLGLDPMSTVAGLAAFEAVLGQPGGAYLVAAGDAGRIEDALDAALVGGAALGELPGGGTAPAGPSGEVGGKGSDGARDDIAGDPELRRRAGRLLRGAVAEVTGLAADDLDERVPFERYGIDSLVIAQLNQVLERLLGAVSKTLFFEYATLGDLAGYVAANHAARVRELAGVPATVPTAPVDLSAGRSGRPDRPECTGRSGRLGCPGRTRRVGCGARPGRCRSGPAGPEESADAIAVIGLSGRYPHGRRPGRVLGQPRRGRDCVTEVPRSAGITARYYDPDPHQAWPVLQLGGAASSTASTGSTRCFFGISPREAELTWTRRSGCSCRPRGTTRRGRRLHARA